MQLFLTSAFSLSVASFSDMGSAAYLKPGHWVAVVLGRYQNSYARLTRAVFTVCA